MARYASAKIEGLNKLVRSLQAAGVQVEDLKDAFGSISKLGANYASSFAPKGKTGKLSSSVRGNRAKNKAVVMAGRASVRYAGVQNFGWPAHNIAPSSFMQKTDEKLKPEAPRLIDQAIQELLRKEGLA